MHCIAWDWSGDIIRIILHVISLNIRILTWKNSNVMITITNSFGHDALSALRLA